MDEQPERPTRRQWMRQAVQASLGINVILADLACAETAASSQVSPLQAAIDSAESRGGGKVIVPAGRHSITTPLRVPGGVELAGESLDSIVSLTGQRQTALHVGARTGPGGESLDQRRHVAPVVRNLTIDGNWDGAALGTGQLVAVTEADRPLLENLVITNSAGLGVALRRTADAVVRRVRVSRTGQDGISFYAHNTAGLIEDCTTRATGDDGFAFVCYEIDGVLQLPVGCRAVACQSFDAGLRGGGAGFKVAGALSTTLERCKSVGVSNAAFWVDVGAVVHCPARGVSILSCSAESFGVSPGDDQEPAEALFVGLDCADVLVDGFEATIGSRKGVRAKGARRLTIARSVFRADRAEQSMPVITLEGVRAGRFVGIELPASAHRPNAILVDAGCEDIDISATSVRPEQVRIRRPAAVNWLP